MGDAGKEREGKYEEKRNGMGREKRAQEVGVETAEERIGSERERG